MQNFATFVETIVCEPTSSDNTVKQKIFAGSLLGDQVVLLSGALSNNCSE